MRLVFDPTHINRLELAPDLWWRVHHEKFGGTAFNSSNLGDARFSPITRQDGTVIPTIYCGSSPEVAFMETILHDLPSPCYGATISLPSMTDEKRRMSCIVNLDTLVLGDLRTIGLRRLGLTRSQLIDSSASAYAVSRDFAMRVYDAMPELDGLVWQSRQEDSSKAMVLFEDRLVSRGHRMVTLHDRDDFNSQEGLTNCLLDLLQQLGVDAVFG